MNEEVDRLALATLARARGARLPRYTPGDVGTGIVHLGIGAFARAHIAVFTDDVLAEAGGDWGICGVSQRSRTVPDRLVPQDGLYTVLERPADEVPRGRVIGALRELACAPDDPSLVVEHIGAETIHVVSLTVTEKGYRYDPATGHLGDDEQTRADIAGWPPQTVVGQLVRGLQRRQRCNGAPIALLSCDNFTGNGSVLRGIVFDFLSRLPSREGEPLVRWVEEAVAFPNTMVDRIVPATTDADRSYVQRMLGLRDEGVVVAEPFSRWVIEDAFTGMRPPWERVGATVTNDVVSHERLKLRMLNAAHSLLAYLGVLSGYDTISETLGDPAIEAVVRRFLDEDQAPTLDPPEGVDPSSYREEVLSRFANSAVRHRTTQVAMDGSQKLPQRLLGSVRERLEDGHVPRFAALLVAAWMRTNDGTDDAGRRVEIEDPLAPEFATRLEGVEDDRERVVRTLSVESVFGVDLGANDDFVQAVSDWYSDLRTHGVRGTLEGILR